MKKKIVTKPFDRYRIPPKQNLFLTPLIWAVCFFPTTFHRLKIKRVNMKGLKPPFLVLATHHSFMDFFVTPRVLMPYRANYVSELEGFENYGEWLYRQAGCLGTRKFVNDIALVKNIKRVMERKGVLVLYPEARYANVGTSSELPQSLGKLVKYLDVPVVTINMKGNYLQSPIWNLKNRKQADLEATVKQLYTQEQISTLTVNEINKALAEELSYDEYAYQLERKIAIIDKFRAEGIEFPLYKCPGCGAEFSNKTSGAEITCTNCNRTRVMNEYGRMVCTDDTEDAFSHITDWYEWQRAQLHKEINEGKYSLDMKVHIESLPNAINFIDLGEGRLIHSETGFRLIFKDYGETKDGELFIPSIESFSVHTEYDYRGKGQCITLSTLDNTYFIYPLEDGFNATKIQFAVEYFYKKAKRKKKSAVD